MYLSVLSSSKIDPIDNDKIPALSFNFVNISEINSLAVDSKCGNYTTIDSIFYQNIS